MSSIDLVVLELLASRMCHDLAGPVGAVNAGVELLGDSRVDAQALNLLGRSGEQAQQHLQLYRFAFGRGGDGQPLDTLCRAAESALGQGGKIRFQWPAIDRIGAVPGMGRLCLNMVMLATEALPVGGSVDVLTEAAADVMRGQMGSITVHARGKRVGLRPETEDAVMGRVPEDQLSARTVQAYFTLLLSRRFNGRLTIWGDGQQEVKLLFSPETALT